MNESRAIGKIQVLLIAIAFVGAACSHEQARQFVAGGPAPGAHPEFAGESEQPAPEIPPIPAHIAARPQAGNSEHGAIDESKRRGLDVVLVIPRSGSRFNDVKARMAQLVESIHRLVPIARVGMVVYDAKPDGIATVPLTNSAPTLLQSTAAIKAQRSTPEKANVRRAAVAAVSGMNWNPGARRVIVLVVDKAIEANEAAGLVEAARKFREIGGIFNAVDALPHSESALQSDNTTREALRAITAAGGGSVKPLDKQKPVQEHPPGPVSDRA